MITFYRCGPVVNFWCMRYEAKHNYFKSLAQRVKNFRNIAKTLSNHHQRLICLYINSEKMLGLQKEDTCGQGACRFSQFGRACYDFH